MNSVNRYADVAERELKDGSVRQPVWNEALAEAGGQPEVAKEIYRHRRVAENLEIEEQRKAAAEELHKLQELNDSLALSIPLKNGMLGIGIILILAVAYLLMSK